MDKGTKAIVGIIIAAIVVVGGYAVFNKKNAQVSEPVDLSLAAVTGPIKLGFFGPLSGDASTYGEAALRGTQIAVDEINNAGGIGGHMVELVAEDGKCDPQAAGAAASKLVTIDQVKFMIGGGCSGETLAAAAITEPAKVVLISPSSTSPKVSQAGDFVFRTYPSDSVAGKIAAKYAFETLGARKVAVITELTDYAQGIREVYTNTFKDLGGEVLFDETYNTGDTDFRTQVLKIKEAGVDAVYVVPQSSTPGVAIFKQLRESGVTATLTTAEVLLDRQVIKDNATLLEGIIGVEASVDYESNTMANAFRESHREKFGGTDPGLYSANAYEAVLLLRDAIALHGLNTEAVRDWLYAVKDRPGVIGSITFDRNGDPIMGENVTKITNGTVEILASVAP